MPRGDARRNARGLHVVVRAVPEPPRRLKGAEDVAERGSECFFDKGDAVLRAERLNKRLHLAVVVAGNHREQVVLDLVIKVAREPCKWQVGERGEQKKE